MTHDQTKIKATEIIEVMDAWGIDKPDQLTIAQTIIRLVYADMRRQTRQNMQREADGTTKKDSKSTRH